MRECKVLLGKKNGTVFYIASGDGDKIDKYLDIMRSVSKDIEFRTALADRGSILELSKSAGDINEKFGMYF